MNMRPGIVSQYTVSNISEETEIQEHEKPENVSPRTLVREFKPRILASGA